MTPFIAVAAGFILGMAAGIGLPRPARLPGRRYLRNVGPSAGPYPPPPLPIGFGFGFRLVSGVADTWACATCGATVCGQDKTIHETWHQERE